MATSRLIYDRYGHLLAAEITSGGIGLPVGKRLLVGRLRAAQATRFAPGRNRTCDLALRRRALYPLSYGR